MGEKDAIEPDHGTTIVVAGSDEPSEAAVEPRGRVDAPTVSETDTTATEDIDADTAASGRALTDDVPAPERASDVPPSDDRAPEATGVDDTRSQDVSADEGGLAQGVAASAEAQTEAVAVDDAALKSLGVNARFDVAAAPSAAVNDESAADDAASESADAAATPGDSAAFVAAAEGLPEDDAKAAAVAAVEDAASDAAEAPGTEESAADSATDDFEPPPRPSAELKAIVEALIFASPEPLSLKALAKLLESEPQEDVANALVGLKEDYQRPGGLQLIEVAGGYQIVTRHDLHEWVRRLFHERSTQKLSVQALETLAVVAYRQPITAAEITEIRGVNTSGVLNTLLERHLIKIVGRKAVVGRPFMYSTTKEFLSRFGLNDLSDLPRVEDMVDALGLEAPLLVERAPLEDQLPLEEPDAEPDDAPGDPDRVAAAAKGDSPEATESRGDPDGSSGSEGPVS